MFHLCIVIVDDTITDTVAGRMRVFESPVVLPPMDGNMLPKQVVIVAAQSMRHRFESCSRKGVAQLVERWIVRDLWVAGSIPVPGNRVAQFGRAMD